MMTIADRSTIGWGDTWLILGITLVLTVAVLLADWRRSR